MAIFSRQRRSSSRDFLTKREAKLFKTWGIWRKIAFWSLFLVTLATCQFLGVPLGLGAFLLLVLAQFVWKRHDDDNDPTLSSLSPGTFAFHVAAIMAAIQDNRRAVFDPHTILGFGVPEEDPDDLLDPSWWPPTRLASWWGIMLAIPLGCIDFGYHYLTTPLYHWKLPAIAAVILSTMGWFMVTQAIASGIRHQGNDRTFGGDGETAPAVMLHKLITKDNMKQMLAKNVVAVSLAGGVGAIVTIIMFLAVNARAGIIFTVITLCAMLFAFFFSLSREGTDIFRAEWKNNLEKAMKWSMIFTSIVKGKGEPIFNAEDTFPSLTEWLQQGKDKDDFNPSTSVATFSYPPGLTFRDVENLSNKLTPSLTTFDGTPATMSMVLPIPVMNPDGSTQPGTDGGLSFYVFWTSEHITLDDVLQEGYDPERIEHFIAVDRYIMTPLRSVKGGGSLVVSSVAMYTTPSSDNKLLELKVYPVDGTPLSVYINNIRSLTDRMGVRWVRCIQDTSGQRPIITFYVGDNPFDEGTRYMQPAGMAKKSLIIADYLWIFSTLKLTGQEGAPVLEYSRPVSDMTDESVFTIPPGIDYASILAAKDKIRTTSGNEFIEIREGVPDLKSVGIPGGAPQLTGRAHFTMVSATKHPLDRLFLFKDYKEQLWGEGRVKGVASLKYGLGIFSNSQIAYDDYNGKIPHLIIAGSSGSGKSVVLENQLLNIIGKNDPVDVQFNIIEPKIGTQIFENVDSVTRYTDSWVPNAGHFYESARDVFHDLVQEMERRNQLMRWHPGKPEKLETAREIALREGPQPDGSPHPMLLPYIILVVEECALLFAPSPSKEDRALQAEITYYATRLARESRSAGIHMVFLTQYPTNESLPSTIRQQCRRIGLRTTNDFASRVIIDQAGLEQMTRKGSGMVEYKDAYREYRGFLVQRSGDVATDDVLQFLEQMPKNPNAHGGSSTINHGKLVLPDLDDSIFAMRKTMMDRQEALAKNPRRNSANKGITDADLPYDMLTVSDDNQVMETAVTLDEFVSKNANKFTFKE